MPVTQKATIPFKGKMKKVIRNEAKLNRLISGYLIVTEPIERVEMLEDDDFFTEQTVPVCKGPGHCAMGALMFGAGISNKRIQAFEDGLDGTYSHGPVARKLFDTYRIDETDADVIISGNDSVRTGTGTYDSVKSFKEGVKSRMEKVLEVIDDLPKRERIRPLLKEVDA